MSQKYLLTRAWSYHFYKGRTPLYNACNQSLARRSLLPVCDVQFERPFSLSDDRRQTSRTKILYDGECSICMVEISVLRRFAKQTGLEYIDITSPDYDPSLHSGISYEEAMKEMHVIVNDKVYLKADAIRKMYDAVGLKWLSNFSRLPIISPICDRLYIIFAKYRLKRALKNCDTSRCSIKLIALKKSIEHSS